MLFPVEEQKHKTSMKVIEKFLSGLPQFIQTPGGDLVPVDKIQNRLGEIQSGKVMIVPLKDLPRKRSFLKRLFSRN